MPKTLPEIVALARETLTAQQTALNSAIPSLPEAVRAELASYRDKINTQLASLPPIEQVQGALEANSLIQWMASLCSEMASLHGKLVEKMGGIGSMQTQLASFEDRIKSGELVEKAKVTAAVEEASARVRSEVLAEVTSTRKGLVETAGLPVPGDEVLSLPVADFTARHQVALKNVEAIKKATGSARAQAALVKRYAWLGETELAGELAGLADILGANTPPAGNPLIGAGAAAGAPAAPEKKTRTVI
jgi:hypothetical protein